MSLRNGPQKVTALSHFTSTLNTVGQANGATQSRRLATSIS